MKNIGKRFVDIWVQKFDNEGNLIEPAEISMDDEGLALGRSNSFRDFNSQVGLVSFDSQHYAMS